MAAETSSLGRGGSGNVGSVNGGMNIPLSFLFLLAFGRD